MSVTSSSAPAIPQAIAAQLCEAIRQEKRGKWVTFNGLWCLVCAAQAKGNPAKMCFSGKPDYRGCLQVNQRYDRQFRRDESE